MHSLSLIFLNALAIHRVCAATSTTADPANPTSPNYVDDVTWLTGYLTVHSLSINSYVYMFLFWFLVGLVFFALSWATWTEVRVSALGARWSKWALRRRTWRKKHTLKKNEAEAKRLGVPVSSLHRQPKSLPSNAQIMTATALVIIVLVICFVGPDYINPDLKLFEFSSSSSSSSSSTTTKRAKLTTPINDQTMNPYIAHYNIQKAWWTSAARTGGVAFALFPLVVALALKAPPFAIFGIPGLVQFGHDKMMRLHRYVGRLIWFVTLLHVLFWVVQVLKDRRETTGELVFAYVWMYQKFRFAWVAFLSMTILMICTLDCIRNPHYEIFYIVHIVFTPMTIIFSALHHPQRGVWGWCAAALALWIGERLWRACWWVYVNGIFRSASTTKKGGNNVVVGNISPYMYYTRPGEKEAPPAHRVTPSGGSTTTLTNTNYEFDQRKGSFDDGKMTHEQFEMGTIPLRAPAPRRASPPGGIALGYESDGDRGEFDTPSRPSSTVYADEVNVRPYGNTHGDGPTPTPGELIELARVQTGNSSASRGMPLQIQTVPTYPPLAHPRFIAAQSPGAGPGPQTSTSLASASASHRFQPQPTRARMHAYAPPPGFALATLLPGRTIRLRLVTPGYQTWAPGQHFLVGIPSVSRFTTHPFSVASVCDEQAALHCDPDANEEAGGMVDPRKRLVQAEAGRELVLLVRAKKGWTKRLWDLISSLQSQGLTSAPGETLPPGSTPPPQGGTSGVVLRTLVDGPFGSAGRTRWGQYSSVLIVSGGSGVSFGLSVLEYVCLCIAGRDGRFLGGFPGGWGVGPKGAWVTQRVRFVWLVREYAHIQWCVSSLRRCLKIVPTDALELNIFVTNFRPPRELLTPTTGPGSGVDALVDVSDDGHLRPPAPRFHAGGGSGKGGYRDSPSDDSLASDTSVDMIVDSYFDGRGEEELGHETHLLDYTNFDGDDDTPMPGEHRLSRRIIKESKMRRARSRKAESAVKAKRELEERAAAGYHAKTPSDEVYGGVKTSTRRYSTQSTAALLPPKTDTDTSGISPISQYSSFSAFSAFDRHAHPQPQTQSPLPPSSFSAFSVPPTHELSPTKQTQTRRFSVSSSTTLKSPSESTPSLSPSTGMSSSGGVRWAESPAASSSDVKSWSGHSSSGAQGSGLALDAQEVRDLQIVSEWARPGKPKLGRILADEVEAAKGRIAVACCGPTGLNALMRKFIAEQIDPARVARSDMRGSIDFIAEDFEY